MGAALDRATEALKTAWHETDTWTAPARAAVSAALHNPNDPDWLVDIVKAVIDESYTIDGFLDPGVDRDVVTRLRAAILGSCS